jgi:hypothetical protein
MTSVFDYELFLELPDDMKMYHIFPALDPISQMCLRNVLLGTPLKSMKELALTDKICGMKEVYFAAILSYLEGTPEPDEIYKSLAQFSMAAVQHFWEQGLFELSKLVAATISENRCELLEWCLDIMPAKEIKLWRCFEGPKILPVLDDSYSGGYRPRMSLLAAKYGCIDVLKVLLRREIILSAKIFEVAGKYRQREVLLMLKETKYYNATRVHRSFITYSASRIAEDVWLDVVHTRRGMGTNEDEKDSVDKEKRTREEREKEEFANWLREVEWMDYLWHAIYPNIMVSYDIETYSPALKVSKFRQIVGRARRSDVHQASNSLHNIVAVAPPLRPTPTRKSEITKLLGLPPTGRYAKREQKRRQRR